VLIMKDLYIVTSGFFIKDLEGAVIKNCVFEWEALSGKTIVKDKKKRLDSDSE